jgi:hypothetical protein
LHDERYGIGAEENDKVLLVSDVGETIWKGVPIVELGESIEDQGR